MSREYTRVSFQLSCDQRLVAGVGGALAYFADRAGLPARSRESLVAALQEFCLDAAPAAEGSAEPLDVAIEDFEDRIEIVVEHHAAYDAAGTLPPPGGKAAPPKEQVALRRLARAVDRIECDTLQGSIRTRLVKFL